MYKKLVILLLTAALVAQDGPQTPPRPQRSALFATPSPSSATPSSALRSLALSSAMSSPVTPGVKRPLFEDGDSDEENTVTFEPFEFSPPRLSPVKRVRRTIKALPEYRTVDEIQQAYNYLERKLHVSGVNRHDLDQYPSDKDTQMVGHLAQQAQKLGDITLIALPLFPFEHLKGGDEQGGYHLEHEDRPVHKLLENTQTHVYGGMATTQARSANQKFSSFFPKGSSMEDITQAVGQAYRNPIVKKDNRILGMSESMGPPK